MPRRFTWLGPAAVAVVGLLAADCGKGNESPAESPLPEAGETPDAAGGSAGYGGWAGSPQDSGKPDAQSSCTPAPIPEGTPEGWEEYPLFNCRFRLYVPPSHDKMPDGLKWEGCSDFGPDSYACRQLVIDWETDSSPYLGGVANGYVENGAVVLQLRKLYLRGTEMAVMSLVLAADGPARQAFWQQYHPRTNFSVMFGPRSVAEGYSAWVGLEYSAGTLTNMVSLAGKQDELRPAILWQGPADSSDSATAVAGTHYYAATGAQVRVFGWDGTDYGVVMPSAYNLDSLVWAGPSLLWSSYSSEIKELWSWTQQDGSRRLLGFGTDGSRGAANLGTDGQDLFWVQGEDRGPTEVEYPNRSIMTAKFTTDASQLVPRRLRSWRPDYIGTERAPPAVGCGYAAARDVPSDGVVDLLIVRLSDGVAWRLRTPEDRHWVWGPPIAITCEEVFTMWGFGGIANIRRIRLDSLGPGMEPD